MRLTLLAFVIYNANLRSITSFDTNPTRYLPISIIEEFDLDLDEFPFLHKYSDWRKRDNKDALPYYLQKTRGHYMSTYPVMPAILSVPVYIVPVLLGLTDGPVASMGFSQSEIVGTLLSKISASLAVAFSVGILYLTLLRLTSKTAALWISLIYAFATSSWSISSQGLWQTAMSQPLLTLTLYFFIKARENTQNVIYASIPLSLSVACRPPDIIFAMIFFIFVIHRYRARILHFVIFPTILGAFLLMYNLYYFGNLMGGYIGMTESLFTYPRWEGFLGLLVSPNRGMLVFSPILLFAFAGLISTLYHRRNLFLTYTAIATVLMVLFYSAWSRWDGAFSFSYRLLVDLLPGLSLFLSEIWDRIFTHRLRKSLVIAFVTYSIFVQIVGTFYYPCDWYDTPVKASIDRSRFWDWGDMEIFRCFRAGPVEPDGLKFLRKVANKK